jgi:hypothetical protein
MFMKIVGRKPSRLPTGNHPAGGRDAPGRQIPTSLWTDTAATIRTGRAARDENSPVDRDPAYPASKSLATNVARMERDAMNIRMMQVELLRAGKRHGHLLSPLAQYLGVFGNAPASLLAQPYEHSDLERDLQDLSYEVNASDRVRREQILARTGERIAAILSSVEGLSNGLASERERADTLTQLRIVLSASELAMLPFELSMALPGVAPPNVWLALQARVPICITRHIRGVSAEGMTWPAIARILFVAGPDTPARQHREALLKALAPWIGRDTKLSDRLVCLEGEQATLANIEREVLAAGREKKPFTHVHLLAHGVPLHDEEKYSPIGLGLYGGNVAGRNLATSLSSRSENQMVRPAVVTLATCQSARVSDVRNRTNASVAHDLHDQGIPLVVASQFPLSVEGSIPFVEQFYEGQLWGEHPLVTLYDIRFRLHKYQDVHDWASLVVYEALPSDLRDQLEHVRYWQTRRAQDHVLDQLEQLAQDVSRGAAGPSDDRASYDERSAIATDYGNRLPRTGPYTLECAGLRAAGQKRIAQAAFQIAVAPELSEEWRQTLFDDCVQRLRDARDEYWHATRSYLAASNEPMRRKANLHWLLIQVLSLDAVLGGRLDEDLRSWNAAQFAAELDTQSKEDDVSAWGHVSLAELALLRLGDPRISDSDLARYARETVEHAKTVLDRVGRNSEHAKTTPRQFRRYIEWWGNPELEWALLRLGVEPRPHWNRDGGLVATAQRVVRMITPPKVTAPPPAFPTPSGTSGPSSSSSSVAPSSMSPSSTAESPSSSSTSSQSASARTLGGGRQSSKAIFTIEMLPAENGDCLWIEYGDPNQPRRILIDCGAESTATLLNSRLETLGRSTPSPFELFVLTHIDADHINGVLPLFEHQAVARGFKDIWFNGWRQINPFLSVKQAEDFSKLLAAPQYGLPWNSAFGANANADDGAGDVPIPRPIVITPGQPLPSVELPDGLRLTLLSPGEAQLQRLGREWGDALEELKPKTAMLGRRPRPEEITDFDRFDVEALARAAERPDRSAPNGSSIALLAEFDDRSILLAGDAYPSVIVSSIEALQGERGRMGQRLSLDALKLSHHGSANATTAALLGAIDCHQYLVSTNGNIFYHPDRETIARILMHGGADPTLIFNYRSEYNEIWEHRALQARHRYSTVFPAADEEGVRVSL